MLGIISYTPTPFQTPSKKCVASQLFNISRNTINLWCQRKAQTGDIKPTPRTQRPPNINDWETFEAFVRAHSDKTQRELAQLWDGDVSQPTISRAIAKMRYSRKKKPTGISSETRRNEQHS